MNSEAQQFATPFTAPHPEMTLTSITKDTVHRSVMSETESLAPLNEVFRARAKVMALIPIKKGDFPLLRWLEQVGREQTSDRKETWS